MIAPEVLAVMDGILSGGRGGRMVNPKEQLLHAVPNVFVG